MKKKDLEEIIELRHRLHRYPELSMRERETKELLKRFIRGRTSCRLVDMPGWFYCVFGGEKPGDRVAFRAEMDALPIEETIELPYGSVRPGISHKCGHDGHAAALCGLALTLEETGTERPVILIFQPGEEIGAGGEACSGIIEPERIRRIYAWHNLEGYPEGAVVIRQGLAHPASEGLTMRFHGKCSHASEPEKGNNPAAAIAETVLQVRKLSERKRGGLVLATVVGMQAGTGDFGISAGDGELALTLRAEREEELALLEQEIIACAERVAERDGLTLQRGISDYFPETRNCAEAVDSVRRAAAGLGCPVLEMDTFLRSSEDFGYCTGRTEGAVYYIGTGEDHAPLHTGEYDFNDNILEIAVDMMAKLAG